MIRRFVTIVACVASLLLAGLTVPSVAAADVKGADVYTTPGVHNVGGRWWKTSCEAYSSNVGAVP